MPPSSIVSGRCSASICSMLLMLRPMPAEQTAVHVSVLGHHKLLHCPMPAVVHMPAVVNPNLHQSGPEG